MNPKLLGTLRKEAGGVHSRRAGRPHVLDEVDIFLFFGEEIANGLGSRNNPGLGVANPALSLLTTVQLGAKRRSEDCSCCLLGIKSGSSLQTHGVSKSRLQLLNEVLVGITEQVGCTTMDREDQRFLVDGNAIGIHKKDQDQATTTVGAGLTGILFLPLVVEGRITGIHPLNGALLGVLDERDIFTETAMDHDHAWGLKEEPFILITIVVHMGVLFGIRELLNVSGPADTGERRIFQEQT